MTVTRDGDKNIVPPVSAEARPKLLRETPHNKSTNAPCGMRLSAAAVDATPPPVVFSGLYWTLLLLLLWGHHQRDVYLARSGYSAIRSV